MTKEVNWPLILAVGLIALLLGGVVGAFAFPSVIEKKVVVKEQVEVEVPVEVEKIVEIPAPNLKDKALATFLESVKDEEDEAGNTIDLLEGYDYDEISVSKVFDEWTVDYFEDKTVVGFSVKLKYDDPTDDDMAEKVVYSVVVTYEEDEDTLVEVI